MFLKSVFVLCACFIAVYGRNCQDLTGVWRNQLGSNMTVLHTSDNRITGEYNTAVESQIRAAQKASDITGLFIPLQKEALVSFTVIFNRGQSLTTWVGQCMVCNGEEILFTTWTLRSIAPNPADQWQSTRINQDTFTRIKNAEVPLHLRGPLLKNERNALCEKTLESGLRKGHWVSEYEEAVGFTECYRNGEIVGSHNDVTLVGRMASTSVKSINTKGDLYKALGFISHNDLTIRGWTGKFLESFTDKRKMQATWLEHTLSDSCLQPRRNVRFGHDSYTLMFGFNGPKETKRTQNIFQSSWKQLGRFVSWLLPLEEK